MCVRAGASEWCCASVRIDWVLVGSGRERHLSGQAARQTPPPPGGQHRRLPCPCELVHISYACAHIHPYIFYLSPFIYIDRYGICRGVHRHIRGGSISIGKYIPVNHDGFIFLLLLCIWVNLRICFVSHSAPPPSLLPMDARCDVLCDTER